MVHLAAANLDEIKEGVTAAVTANFRDGLKSYIGYGKFTDGTISFKLHFRELLI
jgi:hypothetical protein